MAVESIGLTPISPVTADVGTEEIPDFDRITKLPAVPRSTGEGPSAVDVPVVKVHDTSAANSLPARSVATAYYVGNGRSDRG